MITNIINKKKRLHTYLAKAIDVYSEALGKYKCNKVVRFVKVVKKTTDFLDTNVSYLLGKNQKVNLYKNLNMLRRFNDINSFHEYYKSRIIYTPDAMINSVKLKTITQHR